MSNIDIIRPASKNTDPVVDQGNIVRYAERTAALGSVVKRALAHQARISDGQILLHREKPEPAKNHVRLIPVESALDTSSDDEVN